jgi:predicted phage gp36 major capsid-like protein
MRDTETPASPVALFESEVGLDRIGMTVQYVPVMFSTSSALPVGKVGWYSYWRTGSDALVDDAIRVLKVATAP